MESFSPVNKLFMKLINTPHEQSGRESRFPNFTRRISPCSSRNQSSKEVSERCESANKIPHQVLYNPRADVKMYYSEMNKNLCRIRIQELKKPKKATNSEFSCDEIKRNINFRRLKCKDVEEQERRDEKFSQVHNLCFGRKTALFKDGNSTNRSGGDQNVQPDNGSSFPKNSLLIRRRRLKTQKNPSDFEEEEALFNPINEGVKLNLPLDMSSPKDSYEGTRKERRFVRSSKKTSMNFFRTLSQIKLKKKSAHHIIKFQIDQSQIRENLRESARSSILHKNHKAASILRRKPIQSFVSKS
ncbi:unnamed protein product [Moneuplotes crassus]|uniref:Uncharacterized protein n=1 Tax=Euplotes crassus TaxID=5936 RepID=A0AAD1UG52_EUPCR|nr:unnamed protein product [Moneuplotes crassus]